MDQTVFAAGPKNKVGKKKGGLYGATEAGQKCCISFSSEDLSRHTTAYLFHRISLSLLSRLSTSSFGFFFFPVLLLKDLTRRLWVFQSIFFSVVVVCAPPISSASLLGLFCSTPFGGSMPLEFLRFFLAPEDFVCDSHLKPFPGHLFYDPMVSPRHQPLRGGVCVGALEK